MKKLLIISNLITFALLAFMSCEKTTPSETRANPVPLSSAKGSSSSATAPVECNPCFDYTTIPFSGLNAGTAYTVSYNYKTINQPLLYIDGVGDDANSIWFSLESLKNFIWKVETSVCEKKCPKPLQLGIRLYYGRYPEQLTNDLAELNPEFAQRHTVFMVPTFQDESNEQVHWDFDPWHWGNDRCRPKSMSDWFTAFGNKPFGADNSLIFSIGEDQYFNEGNGTLSSAMNHGDLIPPYPLQGSAY